MQAVNVFEELSNNAYPGRGIVIGRSPCGRKIRIGYFIMGRSENSRNRVFVEEGNGIRTEAYDPSKMEDPSLIIYAPVRVYENQTIVTNGDQTDTIYDFMKEGKSFMDALMTRTFEPDAPNYTPRISAVVDGADVAFSILKTQDQDPERAVREFYYYENIAPGHGYYIHTYEHDGNPIPSFEGEPRYWEMVKESFDDFSDHLWESLNEDNKVSLFTRSINLETGEVNTKIYNKNER